MQALNHVDRTTLVPSRHCVPSMPSSRKRRSDVIFSSTTKISGRSVILEHNLPPNSLVFFRNSSLRTLPIPASRIWTQYPFRNVSFLISSSSRPLFTSQLSVFRHLVAGASLSSIFVWNKQRNRHDWIVFVNIVNIDNIVLAAYKDMVMLIVLPDYSAQQHFNCNYKI